MDNEDRSVTSRGAMFPWRLVVPRTSLRCIWLYGEREPLHEGPECPEPMVESRLRMGEGVPRARAVLRSCADIKPERLVAALIDGGEFGECVFTPRREKIEPVAPSTCPLGMSACVVASSSPASMRPRSTILTCSRDTRRVVIGSQGAVSDWRNLSPYSPFS